MLNVIAAEPDPSFISHLFMSFHEVCYVNVTAIALFLIFLMF